MQVCGLPEPRTNTSVFVLGERAYVELHTCRRPSDGERGVKTRCKLVDCGTRQARRRYIDHLDGRHGRRRPAPPAAAQFRHRGRPIGRRSAGTCARGGTAERPIGRAGRAGPGPHARVPGAGRRVSLLARRSARHPPIFDR